MHENDVAKIIVDSCIQIHKEIGPGLLETVYEVILFHELQARELQVARQVPISFRWKNITFEESFRADLIVENKVIVELKSVEKLKPVYAKKLLTYLRLTDKKLGLLVNFGEELMRTGIKRVANGLEE